MIFADHPLGIGANNYVLIANEGYNRAAGVASGVSSELANVHNVYWLVAAESGYFGLVTFLFFLLRPASLAFLCGWRNRRDPRGDLLLGLGVALLTVYIHSFYEWIIVDFEAQYLFVMTVGLVAGLAEQLGYWNLGSARAAWGRRIRLGVSGMGIRHTMLLRHRAAPSP